MHSLKFVVKPILAQNGKSINTHSKIKSSNLCKYDAGACGEFGTRPYIQVSFTNRYKMYPIPPS